MLDLIGYLGIVILCSVIFVAIILLRPDRNKWCLEEESEDIKECNTNGSIKEVGEIRYMNNKPK